MFKPSSVSRWLARILALASLGLVGAAAAYTNTSDGWNLPTGVTALGHDVYALHMKAFWVCVVIGIGVFGVMFYSVFAHRKSKGHAAANFHESTTVEIAWTIVPFLILIALAIPAAGTLIKMEDTRAADMTIKITGFQWKWNYDYLERKVSYFSTLAAESNRARQLGSGIDVTTVKNYLVDVDHPLVLPTGKKIKLLITANDVIHAWWVPDLAVKKDALPGYINETWINIETPGTYRGVCAELCGRDHGFMPIVVNAVTPEQFDQWIAAQGGNPHPPPQGEASVAAVVASVTPTASEGSTGTAAAVTTAVPADSSAAPAPAAATTEVAAAEPVKTAPAAAMSKDDLVKQGESVYKANCLACHQPNGEGLPPNFPALKGSKIANGPAAEHIKQVLNGKGLMTPFKHLSDADLAAVITYERNSWGNKASTVQPKDVAAAR